MSLYQSSCFDFFIIHDTPTARAWERLDFSCTTNNRENNKLITIDTQYDLVLDRLSLLDDIHRMSPTIVPACCLAFERVIMWRLFSFFFARFSYVGLNSSAGLISKLNNELIDRDITFREGSRIGTGCWQLSEDQQICPIFHVPLSWLSSLISTTSPKCRVMQVNSWVWVGHLVRFSQTC